MDGPIRVLVVDDSALMRHRLGTIIGSAPGFKIVGVAKNGLECLRSIPVLRPDVVTLDVEMPEMDGLTTLQRIMRQHPTPVLMVSSITEAGAQTTLDALALGAVDYLAKPSFVAMSGSSPFGSELLTKLGVVARVRPVQLLRLAARAGEPPRAVESSRGAEPAIERTVEAPGASSPERRRLAENERPQMHATPRLPEVAPPGLRTGAAAGRSTQNPLVIVGSSTGGPQALDQIFGTFTAEQPRAPLLVIQHMPPLFTRSLAARLAKRCGLAVREAEEGDQPTMGTVLVAQGGSHLIMGADRRLHLEGSEPLHGVRPAIDRTLYSIAAHWRGPCLVVILTGMGVDGADGARAARARGAQVYAQDEGTSCVYGMPRAVIEAGLASAILPLDRVGPAITQWARAAVAPAASLA